MSLLVGTAAHDTARSRPPGPSSLRAIASAGPTLADRGGRGYETGFGLGAGIEVGGNPHLRSRFRLDTHVFRTRESSWHTTSGTVELMFHARREHSRLWPYLYAGIGYGTAPNYSDFNPPFAGTFGGGLRFRLPGGQEAFVEAGALSANDHVHIPVRVGAVIP